MRFDPTELRKLFEALGFPKAVTWSLDLLRVRAIDLPKRVALEQVPKDFQETYERLEKLAQKKGVFLWQEEGESDPPPGLEDEDDELEPRAKESKERDPSSKGVVAKIDAVLTGKWKTDVEIAEEAGVTLRQARARLYYKVKQDKIVYRRRIEYRKQTKI